VAFHGSRAGGDAKEGPKSPLDSWARIKRRKEPRHPVDISVVVRLLDIASKLEGRILDLSMGGCRIRTNLPFPLGVFRRVEMQFRMDGLPFRLAGVTQAIYDPFNVGIRFLNVSERMREQLGQLIEEITELREREKVVGGPS
jgi:c-di-GMP-binding flagellar brake protein YcgR